MAKGEKIRRDLTDDESRHLNAALAEENPGARQPERDLNSRAVGQRGRERHPRIHLGAGGEYQPQSLSLDRHDARLRFFRILAQILPDIFIELRAVYVTVQDQPELWHCPNVPGGLREWGTRWHLSDHWCWALARETFAQWDAERKGEVMTVSDKTHSVESMVLGMAAWGIVLATTKVDSGSDLFPEEPFNSVGPIPGWLIFNETEDMFRKRTVQQFKLELEAHIKRANAAAKDRGAITISTKGAALEGRLIWLARAAVKRERPAQIWKSLGPPGVRLSAGRTVASRGGFTRRAVEKAIRDTANLIGLTLHET